MTHTYAVMEVSKATFAEIEQKLREAKYFHAILPDTDPNPTLDMHGIGLQVQNSGTDGNAFSVETILSHGTHRGRVEIQLNHERIQIDLIGAREIYHMLGEAIEAAISDELLYRFLTETIGIDDTAASGAMLYFREFRHGSQKHGRSIVVP